MFSKLMTFIFLCVLVFIGGCSNQSIIDSSPQKNNEGFHPDKVVLWHTYSEVETEVFENMVIPLFEKEHPDIDIIPVRKSHNEQLQSAIISRASSNKPPDIIRMDIAWVPLFAELKLLYPLNEFEEFNEIAALLSTEPLKSNFYENNYYGLPLNTNTKISIFNKRLLNQLGTNKLPQTMKEIFTIAKENNWRIGISGLTSWEILPYFYSFGGRLMDETYTHAKGYLDSKDSIQAVTSLLEYYNVGVLSEKMLTKNMNTWQGILEGTYFMIDEGPWFHSVQTDEQLNIINQKTVFAPFPVTNGIGSVLGGESLVISKGSKKIDAAWTFIKWMMTEQPQSMMLNTGLIPTNRNIDFSKQFKQYPYYEVVSQSIEDSLLRPPVAQWSQIDQIFEECLTLIFSGKLTVEQGLTQAAEEIEQILK